MERFEGGSQEAVEVVMGVGDGRQEEVAELGPVET